MNKKEIVIAYLGIGVGLVLWGIDGVVDYLHYNNGRFWMSMAIGTSGHAIYLRLLGVFLWTGFAFFVARLLARHRQAAENITHLNAVLRAIRNVDQLITTEKDRDRLIQRACEGLIESRGYNSAWIAMLDESGRLLTAGEAGLGEAFSTIVEQLKRGESTPCGKKALAQSGVAVIENKASICVNCPIAGHHEGAASMSVRLEHAGKIYGLISVTTPEKRTADPRERALFKEVARDLALALHAIELEERRRRLEEESRKLMSRYQAILETTPDIIMETDVNKVYVWANQAGFDFFGPDVLGKEMSYYFEGEQDTYAKIRPLFDGDKDIVGFESWQQRKDGEKRLLEWRCRVLKDENGDVLGVLSTARDTTDPKRLEEQLRQAQRMEAIGRLAGGVAHDFNNLLTGIKGYIELALRGGGIEDACRQDLTEVLNLADRAAQLTRQLLAFSRRQPLAPIVLNINDVVENSVKMLKRLIGEDIALRFVPDAELGNTRADPVQIEQVLMNLAVNARDAMPDGGKLTIETRNVTLDDDYAATHAKVEPGCYVMLAVSDSGCGMNAETKRHLYEPFFTTKTPSKGTGLGLSTVYGIVKQHGGHIWVYSEPGEGATFKIYLPCVEEEAQKLVAKEESADIPRGTETVLVVEDEPTVRDVACRALENKGYKVLAASCAEDAEALAARHDAEIHLLLTDVVLPGRNGRELYEHLSARRPEMAVLYMSGYTSNAVVHHGMLDEGTPFLHKPFNADALARKVREVLDN